MSLLVMVDEKSALEALEKRELAGFIKPLWRYVWEHRSRPSLDELSSASDHELLAKQTGPSHER